MKPSSGPRKKRMPASMYVGGALLGIAFLGFLFWCMAFMRADSLVKQGIGDVRNYVFILTTYPIFFVSLPLYLGLRLLRRARRQASTHKEEEQP